MNLYLMPATATKFRSCVVLLGFFTASLSAAGGAAAPMVVSSSEITVQVKILGMKSGQALTNNSGVVVWLIPIEEPRRHAFGAPESRYRMIQHNKSFEPHLLVVPAGSKVEFSNLDPWLHDAFSISGSRQFDLGFFRHGIRHVEFDRAGVSYVFCRIHPGMEGVVLTVESPYFGVSDRSGHVSISNVPAGSYRLHVWYEGASLKALGALQSPVLVVSERCVLPPISLQIAKQNSPVLSLAPSHP